MTNPFSTNSLINEFEFPLTKGGEGSGRYPKGSGLANAVAQIETTYPNKDEFQQTSMSLVADAQRALKRIILDVPQQMAELPTMSTKQLDAINEQKEIIGELAGYQEDSNHNLAMWDFFGSLNDAKDSFKEALDAQASGDEDKTADAIADANYKLRVAYAMGGAAYAHLTNTWNSDAISY